jgi:hypothetical protein
MDSAAFQELRVALSGSAAFLRCGSIASEKKNARQEWSKQQASS